MPLKIKIQVALRMEMRYTIPQVLNCDILKCYALLSKQSKKESQIKPL